MHSYPTAPLESQLAHVNVCQPLTFEIYFIRHVAVESGWAWRHISNRKTGKGLTNGVARRVLLLADLLPTYNLHLHPPKTPAVTTPYGTEATQAEGSDYAGGK